MNKTMVPVQLRLNFGEPGNLQEGDTLDSFVAVIADPIDRQPPDGKIVNLQLFIAEQRQAEKDAVYRGILESVKLI